MATNVGPQWEPSAEAVEALAKELCAAHCEGTIYGVQWPNLKGLDARNGYRDEARFVLRRQHAREALLTGAIAAAACELDRANEQCAHRILLKVMCDYAKLDAPKVPTLLEAAKAVTAAYERECAVQTHLIALKAAVEREERK